MNKMLHNNNLYFSKLATNHLVSLQLLHFFSSISLNVTDLKKISSKAVEILTPLATIKLVHSVSCADKSLYSRALQSMVVSQLGIKMKQQRSKFIHPSKFILKYNKKNKYTGIPSWSLLSSPITKYCFCSKQIKWFQNNSLKLSEVSCLSLMTLETV